MKFNPLEFKAPYISQKEIWIQADQFRATYWLKKELPVNILEIIEFDLGLDIIPISGLRESGDIHAVLLGNLTAIAVDKNEFMDDRYESRIRFSMAHEVGHLVLHSNLYKQISHETIEDWRDFITSIPEQEYTWIEQHAYEFAGRLLVPGDILESEFKKAIKYINENQRTQFDKVTLSDYIAHSIFRVFGVSEQVIAKRLLKENLLP